MQEAQQSIVHNENDQQSLSWLLSSSNYLKLFKLEFKKEKVEKSYQVNSIDQNKKFSILVSFAVILYQIVIGLIQYFFFKDLSGAIIEFVYSFVNCLLLIKLRKHFYIVQILQCICFLSFEVIFMETFVMTRIYQNDRSDDLQGYFFTLGLLSMCLIYILACALHKWYYKALLVETAIIHYTLRANSSIVKAFTYYPIFYVSIVLFFILFYMKEKFERDLFYKLYLKREENKAFKDLLENTVPSSIFVAKLRENNFSQPHQGSSIKKSVKQKINSLFSFFKRNSQKKQTKLNEEQNNNTPNQYDNATFPYPNNSKMKIVFANSHCKRKFATENLEFLQKNMNYLFSQGSLAAVRDNSQGSSEEFRSKRKLSSQTKRQTSINQEFQTCILQFIWDQFQKIKVCKQDQPKRHNDEYFNQNEEVHLNCIYKKNKVLIQEYENLQKQNILEADKAIKKDSSYKSNLCQNYININDEKKETKVQDIRSKAGSIMQFHNLKVAQRLGKDVNHSQNTVNANSDPNMQFESITKVRRDFDKKNFLFIPDEMHFDIKIVKCKWEDEVAVMVLLSDISQKVVNERMRQVNNYKNEMLSSITHNLKTPLNAVMIMIESAILSNSLQQAQKQLQLAQNSGRLLLYMINDLLDYSRLSSSRPFHLSFQSFYLQDLLLNIKSLLYQQFQSKNIDLQFHIFIKDVNQILINDKQRIEQVLLNLCQNALKFTFQGFVKINVFEDETRPNDLFFQVQDSGLGISDEAKKNLFKIYGNMIINSQNKRHGVGLGLAVCRKLVSQLGSEKVIQIESFKGKGSSFTFSIYKKHPFNQEDDILLPKFRSLKYIQMKKNVSEKELVMNSNQNVQLIENQRLRRNSLTNMKKSIHFEENNPLTKISSQNMEETLNGKSQFNLQNQVKNKEKNSSQSSSSMETSKKDIFNEKQNNQSINFLNLSKQKILLNNEIPQNNKFKLNAKDQKPKSIYNRQCSLEFQQLCNNLTSTEEDCSEKKQAISIPLMSTKILEEKNLSANNCGSNQQFIHHTQSDTHLNLKEDNANELKKKSKTLVQHQKILYQNNQFNFNHNFNLMQTSEQSSTPISSNKTIVQAQIFQEYQLRDQFIKQSQASTSQNLNFNTLQNQREDSQQYNRICKNSISQPRLSILQELDASTQNESSVLKNAIFRAAHLKAENQFDSIQPYSCLKYNEMADFGNTSTPKSSPTTNYQLDMLNQLIWKKTNLLIVDDTIFNIMALKTILKNVNNLVFDEAYNGQQAIEKVLQKKNYDLIFMDINMPVLDGFEATQSITRLIEQKKIPYTTIIIVSAFNDESDRQRSFQSGAKAHIDKPVTLDNIYKAIKTVKLPHLQVS
ncbi:response regulator receiver domain protein (macronuclear) [Tetrahymena thermophila SB210]|uniref:Response regulator receiver domain protein n=1 Tax=Tetrahymena thermophila (strain SB210) TaxID=312017 RepID=I7MB79_TETTS|nr:response regulator receiver domain protein [Tetrahymena thermophila SB210]EAS07821.2 response regulator receiver domain protein [Tetrahymena thermophila SB210]|eukprot:XP_001028063.2 response regulator receiver domain protein [Tetrahymena thermophila SB210]